MRTPDYAEYRRIFSAIPKPFAYVDLDLLDQNIRDIAQAAGGKKVRIASKSVRCVDILRRILLADPVFQGVMCYTPDEAAFLVRLGFRDLLLGYPIWDPERIAELAELIHGGAEITLMADSLDHVRHIESIAEARGVTVPLCLDIDMSTDYPGLRFGVWRSPLRSWANVRPVAERIAQSVWVRLDGIMGYEAQIAGVADSMPGNPAKNALIRALKRHSAKRVALRREHVAREIAAMGMELRFVNAGGTGSFDTSRQEPDVTELTAGSGFYSPALFDHYRSFRYRPAAGFAVEVVRQPAEGIITCLGGGYTASGSAGPEKLPKPFLPEGLTLLPLEGAGEVQTPLRYRGDTPPGLGDPVFFRHAKAGELCERFSKLHAVSGGSVVAEYPTYRGMGACFL